jgi:uncharacterized repeat protein (TIGR02543 family)
MKKQQTIIFILASVLCLLFLGCEAMATLFHGPKPEEEQVSTYTVTFDANSGSGTAPAKMTANAGSRIMLPGVGGLFKSGYAFTGWNTNIPGTGTHYNAGSSYTVTGNITLYAEWIVGYTVRFDANGGSGTPPSSMARAAGSSITLPAAGGLSRSGYAFIGWNTSATGTGTNYNAGFSYTVTDDITLYARWSYDGSLYIGDTGPGGGEIFYSNASGFTMTDTGERCHYLEYTDLGHYAWASSGYTTTEITGTSTSLGSGRRNTALILAVDVNAPAAKACKDYTGGGKTDWFLPSTGEIIVMYLQVNSVFYILSSCQAYASGNVVNVRFSWNEDPRTDLTSKTSSASATYAVRAF